MAKWKGDDNGMCRCFYLHPVKTEEIFSALSSSRGHKEWKKAYKGQQSKNRFIY
jgi:hypothetical protein